MDILVTQARGRVGHANLGIPERAQVLVLLFIRRGFALQGGFGSRDDAAQPVLLGADDRVQVGRIPEFALAPLAHRFGGEKYERHGRDGAVRWPTAPCGDRAGASGVRAEGGRVPCSSSSLAPDELHENVLEGMHARGRRAGSSRVSQARMRPPWMIAMRSQSFSASLMM